MFRCRLLSYAGLVLLFLLLLGTFAGLFKFGWAVVPLSVLLPGILVLTGAFDDGENVVILLVSSVVWSGLVALGWCAGQLLRRTVPSWPVTT